MSAGRATARLRLLGWLIVAALGFAVPVLRAATDEPQIPAPVGFVNDHAGVMDEASRARVPAVPAGKRDLVLKLGPRP